MALSFPSLCANATALKPSSASTPKDVAMEQERNERKYAKTIVGNRRAAHLECRVTLRPAQRRRFELHLGGKKQTIKK